MHHFVVLSLIWTITSAQDTTACDPACADRDICVSNTCINIVCDPLCGDTEQCVNGDCININDLLSQINPIATECNGFDNCAAYIAGCDTWYYDTETDTLASEPLQTDPTMPSCDPNNPPTSQCTQCINGYVLADQSTCCVVSDQTIETQIDASILALIPQIDTDLDGQISKSEYDTFVAFVPSINSNPDLANLLFKSIDANTDGFLTEAELQAYLYIQLHANTIGTNVPLCDPICADTDVCIIDTCINLICDPLCVNPKQCLNGHCIDLNELLPIIDTTGDGYINKAEFDNFVQLFLQLSDEDKNQLFSEIDVNSNGLLSVGEIQNYLSAQLDTIDAYLWTDVQTNDDEIAPDVIETGVIETGTVEIGTDQNAVSDAGDAGAMTNDGNNSHDIFGINNAKPAETYSILGVIVIAGVVILIAMIWCIYQYNAKKKAVKKVNEMEEVHQNKRNNKKPVYETVIVTETSCINS